MIIVACILVFTYFQYSSFSSSLLLLLNLYLNNHLHLIHLIHLIHLHSNLLNHHNYLLIPNGKRKIKNYYMIFKYLEHFDKEVQRIFIDQINS